MVTVICGELRKLDGGIVHPLFTVPLLVHLVVGQASLFGLAIFTVLPGENSPSQGIVADHCEILRLGQGQNFNFCLAFNQIVHELNAMKRCPTVLRGDTQRFGELPGGKIADTGVANFALGHHIIQSPQGFFKRRMLV